MKKLLLTVLILVLTSTMAWAADDDIELKLKDSGTGSALSRFINYRRTQNMLADGSNSVDQVMFKDGTAAAPSITFGSDKKTGIYHRNTYDLGFSTNGSLKMTIASSGALLVGVATDDGANKLQVNGSAIFTGDVSIPGGSITTLWETFDPTNGARTYTNRAAGIPTAKSLDHIYTFTNDVVTNFSSLTGVASPTGRLTITLLDSQETAVFMLREGGTPALRLIEDAGSLFDDDNTDTKFCVWESAGVYYIRNRIGVSNRILLSWRGRP